MKKAIYKYSLQVTEKQSIELPVGSEILAVQTQFNQPNLWALIDPKETKMEIRHIETCGTGHAINCDDEIKRQYISTYQTDGGNYVFHTFERIN